MTDFTRALPAGKLRQMPLFLAEMARGIARQRLGLYPSVREVLDVLRGRYPLAVVTDAQSAVMPGVSITKIRRPTGVKHSSASA